MDRVYKSDIPASVSELERLQREFARLDRATDWNKLRIEPVLAHAKSLDRLLRSTEFARETARLRRGVGMFHADLVYLRENIRGLKAVLAAETKSSIRKAPDRAAKRRNSPR
jgi:hypothetical protein